MDRSGLSRSDRAAWVVAAAGGAVLVVALFIFMGSQGWGYDFAAYDAAARRLLAGEPLYLPDTAQLYAAGAYEGLYLYPPPLAIALMPLALAPPDVATFLWLVLRVVALVVGCAVMPVARWTRLATFGVACLSFPVLNDLNLGNISVLAFALVAVAWRWSGTPVAAIAHAVLVAIRIPFLLYFLTWLARADMRRIAATAVAGLALLALSLPIVGVQTYVDYVTIIRSLPDISTGPHNLSLKSTLVAVNAPEAVAMVAVPLGAMFAAGATVFAARRRDAAVAVVVTAIATLLVWPFLHPHYLVLLILPAALLADRGWRLAVLLPLAGWLPDPILPLVPLLVIVALLRIGPAPVPEAGQLPSADVAATS
jgi:hypothetical protein